MRKLKNTRSTYNINNALSGSIALGYAIAGDNEKVEEYRTIHEANVSNIAQGYAMVENHVKVEEYRTTHNANVNLIAHGYKLVGNFIKQRDYDINFILNSYIKERADVCDSKGQTKEYYHNKFFTSFQKSFKKKTEAVNALQEALDGDNVDLSKHLSTLRNGKLGHELRKFIKSGKANGIVGKKVNTVSEFVNALQEKISFEPKSN